MTKLINFQGIIIKKKDINDSDRLLTVFTTTFGKITVLVKGINKSKRRDKTSCDILTYSRFVAYKKGENYLASTVDTLESYETTKLDMSKIGLGLYILSILNNILNYEERKTYLFNITEKSLLYLEKEESKEKLYLLISFYLYHLIDKEGIDFNIEVGNKFSILSSYLGKNKHEDSIELNENQEFILRKIKEGKSKELLITKLEGRDIFFLILLLEKYINYHLELNINIKTYIWEEAE